MMKCSVMEVWTCPRKGKSHATRERERSDDDDDEEEEEEEEEER